MFCWPNEMRIKGANNGVNFIQNEIKLEYHIHIREWIYQNKPHIGKMYKLNSMRKYQK